jgi:bacterioferritin (cytochrome b1)
VEIQELKDLGGLPVVVLRAPIETFLPPDNFILQITQLSGIPAFQEIIDLDAAENIPDPLKEALKACLDG